MPILQRKRARVPAHHYLRPGVQHMSHPGPMAVAPIHQYQLSGRKLVTPQLLPAGLVGQFVIVTSQFGLPNAVVQAQVRARAAGFLNIGGVDDSQPMRIGPAEAAQPSLLFHKQVPGQFFEPTLRLAQALE